MQKQKEIDTVKQIIHNNKYITSLVNRVHNSKKHKQILEEDKQTHKWVKFVCVGKETRYITKLFKNTPLKVAYTTNNNLGKLLEVQKTEKLNKFDRNGVYQLTCPACQKKYVGQTGRPFHVRFREHYRDYKYPNNKSKFAQHVIEEGHAFGPKENIMDMIHIENKGRMLDTLEKFYIYEETQLGTQINDKLTVQANPIFEAVVQNNPHRVQ
jgi:hypothetical protein